jgi:hypothetical protein
MHMIYISAFTSIYIKCFSAKNTYIHTAAQLLLDQNQKPKPATQSEKCIKLQNKNDKAFLNQNQVQMRICFQ